MSEGEPSYIDYEAFLDPEFSAAGFANTLVLSTNNATDTPLDLSTPLSRVLFDLQEIDTHIHGLTTKSALPLLAHTQDQTSAAERILKETDSQVTSVTQGYKRLEKEVLQKWQVADEARVAAEKSLATVRLARAVSRALALGRQLESQVAEITGRGTAGQSNADGTGASPAPKEGFRALERAAYTILNLRRLFSASSEDEEGYGLDRVKVARTLRNEFVIPAENMVKARAQQTINRFSLSNLGGASRDQAAVASSYKQIRDARSRLATAATTLYLLSPAPKESTTVAEYKPELLLSTLHGYIQTSIRTSTNTLTRALSQLSLMERTLADVSTRCQDIVALESILKGLRVPSHPLLVSPAANADQADPAPSISTANLLQPLLHALDTSSLPSYYWRSLASSLTSPVQEIINRNNVSARNLRTGKERLKREIKDCVMRSSKVSTTSLLAEKGRVGDTVDVGNWEREAAVMVSSIVGPLNR